MRLSSILMANQIISERPQSVLEVNKGNAQSFVRFVNKDIPETLVMLLDLPLQKSTVHVQVLL